jgi:putative endonuclease
MKFTTYVLRDELGKFYKGVTSDLKRRLSEHRHGKTFTTRKMRGALEVVYTEEFDTFESARQREVYFKTAAGRRFLNKKLGL